MANEFFFRVPLTEGIIVKRSSIYTMTVRVDEVETVCHCPTTGRIGNLDVCGLPCLLSSSDDPKRKTKFTVEAISLDLPDSNDKQWIGINQNMANRFVEHYLRNGGLSRIVGSGGDVRREVMLGSSKLDFFVNDIYLEVKTPLQTLQVNIPPHVKTKPVTPFSSTDRMVRHIGELADSLAEHEKAVLLIVFIYDNPGFRIINPSTNAREVSRAVKDCVSRGVETWQVNFRLTPEKVELESCHPVDIEIPEFLD